MIKTNKCEVCKKDFRIFPYRRAKYCSMKCYLLARWGTGLCKQCRKPSKYRFCSDRCRKDYWNENDWGIKKKNYWIKKKALIESLGGKCVKCGESDFRVLDINHIDRNKKKKAFKGQYNWGRRFQDWDKNKGNLELLCANCHRKHTWEQMKYGKKSPNAD